MGLNSSGNPDKDSSYWELVLRKEVRLVVRLIGEGGGWSWGESGVRAWDGMEVSVRLNSRGEGVRLTGITCMALPMGPA